MFRHPGPDPRSVPQLRRTVRGIRPSGREDTRLDRTGLPFCRDVSGGRAGRVRPVSVLPRARGGRVMDRASCLNRSRGHRGTFRDAPHSLGYLRPVSKGSTPLAESERSGNSPSKVRLGVRRSDGPNAAPLPAGRVPLALRTDQPTPENPSPTIAPAAQSAAQPTSALI